MQIEYRYTQTGKPIAVLSGDPKDLSNLILGVKTLLSSTVHEDIRKKAKEHLEIFLRDLPELYFSYLVQGVKEQRSFEGSQSILELMKIQQRS